MSGPGDTARASDHRKRAGREQPSKHQIRRRVPTSKKSGRLQPWEEDGWRLLALRHSKQRGRSVARWLAPEDVSHRLAPRGGSLVVDIHMYARRKRGKSRPHARVVWRGFEKPEGRGHQAFSTWEPFPRKFNRVPPKRANALLHFMYEHLLKDASFPARRAGR
jgi:hypothetical protein